MNKYMEKFDLINPVTHETDLSKCEISKCDWDVVIKGKSYQVVRIKGKYHTIGGRCGNNDFYAYPLDEKMSVHNLRQLEDYRIAPRWGFRVEHNAYLKCKWDENMIRANYYITITRNDEDFYSFGCNDMAYGVAKAQTLIVDFSEHVIPFSLRSWQNEVVNRKIYYYEQPAVITEFLGGDDLRVIIKMCDPTYIPERWKNSDFPSSWGDEENKHVTTILDENIWWFRNED